MLIRARSKVVALSVRVFPDAYVVSAMHKNPLFLSEVAEAGKEVYREIREEKDGEMRTVWELVAETEWEAQLLRAKARFHREAEGNLHRYTWRLSLPRKVQPQNGEGVGE